MKFGRLTFDLHLLCWTKIKRPQSKTTNFETIREEHTAGGGERNGTCQDLGTGCGFLSKGITARIDKKWE